MKHFRLNVPILFQWSDFDQPAELIAEVADLNGTEGRRVVAGSAFGWKFSVADYQSNAGSNNPDHHRIYNSHWLCPGVVLKGRYRLQANAGADYRVPVAGC